MILPKYRLGDILQWQAGKCATTISVYGRRVVKKRGRSWDHGRPPGRHDFIICVDVSLSSSSIIFTVRSCEGLSMESGKACIATVDDLKV